MTTLTERLLKGEKTESQSSTGKTLTERLLAEQQKLTSQPSILQPIKQSQGIGKSFMAGVKNAPLPKLIDKITPDWYKKFKGYKEPEKDFSPATTGEKIAYGAGNIAGDLPMWLAGYGVATKAGTMLAPKLLKAATAINNLSKTKKLMAVEGLKGAATGGMVAPVHSVVEKDNPKELAQRLGAYVLGGAVLDPLFVGAGVGLKSIFNKVKLANPKATTQQLQNLAEREIAKDIGVNFDNLNPTQKARLNRLVKENFGIAVEGQGQTLPAPKGMGQGFTMTDPSKVKIVPKELPKFSGKQSFRNIELENATKEYNQATETIQNHFKTNELRADEVKSIPKVLGINLDELASNIVKAENMTQTLRGEAAQNKLARAAGVLESPSQLAKPTAPQSPLQFKRTIERPRGVMDERNLTTSQLPGGASANAIPPTGTKPLTGELPGPGKAINEVAATAETAEGFRAKIDRNPKTERKTFGQVYDNLRTQFVDDVAPLEKLEKDIRGKIASAEDSLYKSARLFRGSPTKATEVVRTKLAPIIQNIEKQGYSYQDLGDYALAVHAGDVNAKGINSGFTDGQIQAVLNKFGTPEMEAARKELIKVSNDLLDELANAQVISRDTVKALREKHPNYMPLFRSFDDDKVEFAKGFSKALANVSSPLKKLEGSSRDVVDPIESMVKNVFQITNTAERNKVALQLAKLADEDIAGAFVRKVADNEGTARKNVVNVLQNGEKVKYEVEPEVYKAMLDLEGKSSEFYIRMLQKPASLLRAGATLTPEFSLRNPMRDVLQAYVVSNSGFNPLIDFPIALADVITKGKYFDKVGAKSMYSDWLKANGGYGNMISMDREMHREAMESALKEPISKKVVNIVNPKAWISVLRAVSDTMESATKLGEFRAATRKGVSPQEAAYQSRDIMDFARSGSSTREINKIVAFFNANIQGKSKIIRAIQENPVGVTTRAFKAITLPTVGIYAIQKAMSNDVQKATIEDAPQWQKDTFWLIPIPGTDMVGRIPKPFDLAPIFANVPERMLEYIYENDKNAFDGFVRDAMAGASLPVMPTGLLPILEGVANYSLFRQAPIIPQREQGLNYPDQYDINTSETAKIVAKGVNKLTGGEGSLKNFGSPRIIDNTIRGMTAGLGDLGLTAIDAVIKGLSESKGPEKPKKSLPQLPVAKAFLVNQSGTGEAVNYLYGEKDKLLRKKNSAEINKTSFTQNADLMFIERETKKIGDISKKMKDIQNDKTMSAEEKRKELDKLNQHRNEIARDAKKKLQK